MSRLHQGRGSRDRRAARPRWNLEIGSFTGPLERGSVEWTTGGLPDTLRASMPAANVIQWCVPITLGRLIG